MAQAGDPRNNYPSSTLPLPRHEKRRHHDNTSSPQQQPQSLGPVQPPLRRMSIGGGQIVPSYPHEKTPGLNQPLPPVSSNLLHSHLSALVSVIAYIMFLFPYLCSLTFRPVEGEDGSYLPHPARLPTSHTHFLPKTPPTTPIITPVVHIPGRNRNQILSLSPGDRLSYRNISSHETKTKGHPTRNRSTLLLLRDITRLPKVGAVTMATRHI